MSNQENPQSTDIAVRSSREARVLQPLTETEGKFPPFRREWSASFDVLRMFWVSSLGIEIKWKSPPCSLLPRVGSRFKVVYWIELVIAGRYCVRRRVYGRWKCFEL
ncbi:hypothetical protein TNIN_356181 [Trichonephila inaurata madagascariensis]|uniref:Uncharacterized protein n=1 Tax=Trichonephila inaurata madagascariensis TaxID=2747483 RepID=A0A8X6Y0C5_9ARAC|nr:hypothetical protein TNIN_356181 [Trichonephila inaurata madagascariensis]